jgi:hypothetical protein
VAAFFCAIRWLWQISPFGRKDGAGRAVNQEISIAVCIFLKKRKNGVFSFIKKVNFATFL